MPQKYHRRWLYSILAIILLLALGAGGFAWQARHDIQRSLERAALPSPMAYRPTTLPITPSPKLGEGRDEVFPLSPSPKIGEGGGEVVKPPAALPSELNLAVPFTAQAPHAKW